VIKIDRLAVRDVMKRFEEWARGGRKRHGPNALAGWSKSDTALRLHSTFKPIPKRIEDKFFPSLQTGHFDRVTLDTPWGPKKTVYILFTAGLPERHVGVAQAHKKFSYIEVYYPYDSSWKDVLEPSRLRAIQSTLLHELTHAVDWPASVAGVLPGGKDWSEHTLSNLSRYYNSPTEVRAHLRSVYEEVATGIGFDVMMDNSEKPASHYIQKALARSSRWKTLEQFLTPENRKYVLKKLYLELDAVVRRARREVSHERAERMQEALDLSSSHVRQVRQKLEKPRPTSRPSVVMSSVVDAMVKRVPLDIIPRRTFEKIAKRHELLIRSQALLGKTPDQIAEKVSAEDGRRFDRLMRSS